jgi:hypothetical protein
MKEFAKDRSFDAVAFDVVRVLPSLPGSLEAGVRPLPWLAVAIPGGSILIVL